MLPDRLRTLRVGAKKTQKELATFLGITRQGYGNYESGNTEPDQKTINALADFFKVSIDFLYGRTDTPKPDLTTQLISSTVNQNEKDIGRAFLGGADKYTEEELDLARAAAKAAVEAYRKAQRKRDEINNK